MYSIALAIGLSCGAGCGSVSTPFLTAYVLGKGKNLRSSLITTMIFSLGKIFIMALLGGLTAFLGTELIDKGITFLGIEIVDFFSYMTLFIGIYFIYKGIRGSSCKSCSKNQIESQLNVSSSRYSYKEFLLLFVAGMIYGITPCVPLLTMLSMSVGLSVLGGICLLAFFGLVTCLTPSIIQNLVAGLVSKKVQIDLKEKYRYISIIAGVVMSVTSIIALV